MIDGAAVAERHAMEDVSLSLSKGREAIRARDFDRASRFLDDALAEIDAMIAIGQLGGLGLSEEDLDELETPAFEGLDEGFRRGVTL